MGKTKFSEGDVVILWAKKDVDLYSPNMMVEVVEQDMVDVVWFSSDDCLHRATLDTDLLKKL